MKTKLKERISNAREAFFANESSLRGEIAVRNDCNLQNREANSEVISSSIWGFAKIILFFAPGVSLLYFVTLILTDVLISQGENIKHSTFAFFWLIFGAFLMMFGVGKLKELRYLKVVGSVLVSSLAVALSFLFISFDVKAEFFASYSLYILPIIMFIAYMIKKRIDSETENK